MFLRELRAYAPVAILACVTISLLGLVYASFACGAGHAAVVFILLAIIAGVHVRSEFIEVRRQRRALRNPPFTTVAGQAGRRKTY